VPRWAQLSYTSIEGGPDRPGGWQVKETFGELDGEEEEYLRDQVDARMDVGAPLQRFPAREEIAALPRRLVYVERRAGEAGAYWHTVAAGADATGRPGNVFVHALLDRQLHDPGSRDAGSREAGSREAGQAGAARPIELWRSPDWLCPFGADDVDRSVLQPIDAPRPGTSVSVDSVLEFVLDPGYWRVGMLSVLLDAVDAVLAGGPRVVLGTVSPDSAAMWIGAISYLMPAGLSRRLGFSTYERAARLDAAWRRGVGLAAVPVGDVDQLRDPNVVVLNELEDVQLGDLGDLPHRSAAGSVVTVTEWSVIARVALLDFNVAERLLKELDSVAARVECRGSKPAWALAMAVAGAPEVFRDALSEAAAVIAEGSPPGLRAAPELFTRASEVVDRRTESAKGAWELLQRTRSPGAALSEMVLHNYIRRAFEEADWLDQPDGVPAKRLSAPDPGLLAVARSKAVELCAGTRGSSGGVEEQVGLWAHALRLVDFAVRSGVLQPRQEAPDRADDPFVDLLLAGAVKGLLLLPKWASGLTGTVGPLGEEALAGYVRPLLCEALDRDPPDATVQHFAPEMYGWLFPLTGRAVPAQEAPAHEAPAQEGPGAPVALVGPPVTSCSGRVDLHLLEIEHATGVARRYEGVDAAELQSWRLFAVRGLLQRDRRSSHARSSELCEAAEKIATDLTALDLLSVGEEFPRALSVTPLVRALQRDPWGPGVQQLAAHVYAGAPNFRADAHVRAGGGTALGDLAHLRMNVSVGGFPHGGNVVRREATEVAKALCDASEVELSRAVEEEIAVRALVALTVLLCGIPPAHAEADGPEGQAGWRRAKAQPGALVDWPRMERLAEVADSAGVEEELGHCLDEGAYDETHMLDVAIMGSPNFLGELSPICRRYGRLHGISLGGGTASVPLVDLLVRTAFQRGRVNQEYAKFEQRVDDFVRDVLGSCPQGDVAKALATCRKFAKRRWGELQGSADDAGRAKVLGALKGIVRRPQ
jgi:hypothetical protein